MQKRIRNRCALCGNSTIFEFEKLGYSIHHCLYCGLYSLDFVGTYTSFIQHYYKKGYFSGKDNICAYADYKKDRKIILKNHQRYLHGIQHYIKNGRILDIGCAYGYFLELANDQGFEVQGIDVSKHAISYAKKKFGNRVSVDTIETSRFKKNTFDAVTLFDVFEHLYNPVENLTAIRTILKNEGLLVIQTGDAGSKWATFWGKRWHFFAPPQHFFFYNTKTISMMLELTGYTVLKIEHTGKWLSLGYILHLMRTINKNFIAKYIFPWIKDSELSEIPIYLNFGDNMIVYAKKSKQP